MNDFIELTKHGLANCKNTADVRKLSAKLFRNIDNKSSTSIFPICEELLKQNIFQLGIIAFDFAHRMSEQYDETTFDLFEIWLEKYVSGWGDCDDFCTHAFGELIIQQPHLFTKVKQWATREEFWMRRASAVVLIPAISKGMHTKFNALEISDLLMEDNHYLVLKGYGWMLKILNNKEHDLVVDYLVKHHKVMPRVAYRYAIEKMNKEEKSYLMGL